MLIFGWSVKGKMWNCCINLKLNCIYNQLFMLIIESDNVYYRFFIARNGATRQSRSLIDFRRDCHALLRRLAMTKSLGQMT